MPAPLPLHQRNRRAALRLALRRCGVAALRRGPAWRRPFGRDLPAALLEDVVAIGAARRASLRCADRPSPRMASAGGVPPPPALSHRGHVEVNHVEKPQRPQRVRVAG
ncbi:MAG: hypothetical protein ABI699_01510 [Caldimonas sp.]